MLLCYQAIQSAPKGTDCRLRDERDRSAFANELSLHRTCLTQICPRRLRERSADFSFYSRALQSRDAALLWVRIPMALGFRRIEFVSHRRSDLRPLSCYREVTCPL